MLNDIVLVPMEPVPTMLGTWTRLKAMGEVTISTRTHFGRTYYLTVVRMPDGMSFSSENEDLCMGFSSLYHHIVKVSERKQAPEKQKEEMEIKTIW